MRIRCKVENRANSSTSNWENTGERFRIGRDPDCDLCLTGDGTDSVSNEHAQIELTSSGGVLTDLNSTNGTFLNSKQINSAASLKVGDIIELGREGPRITIELVDLSEDSASHSIATNEPQNLTNEEDSVGRPAPLSHVSTADPVPATPASPNTPLVSRSSASVSEVPQVAGPGSIAAAPPLTPAPITTKSPHERPIKTREMVKAVEAGQRKMWVAVAVGAALLIFLGVGIFIFLSRKIDKGGTVIYKELLKSTVWIVTDDGEGSGSLVDYDHRLVITNHHVVDDALEVKVYFPQVNDGVPLTHRADYAQHVQGVRARVVVTDPSTDLAVIELDWLPSKGVKSLQIADESAKPGELVHSIGNPGAAEGELWVHTSGTVRNVSHKDTLLGQDQRLNAWVLYTQSPINPGDSGGPVVNASCQLVGVNSHHKTTARLMSGAIDVRHVKQIMYRAGSPQD